MEELVGGVPRLEQVGVGLPPGHRPQDPRRRRSVPPRAPRNEKRPLGEGVELAGQGQELGPGSLCQPVIGEDEGHLLAGLTQGSQGPLSAGHGVLADDVVVTAVTLFELMAYGVERGGVVVNDEQHGLLVLSHPVHPTLPRAVVPCPGVLRHGSIEAIIAISTARSIYSGRFLMPILPWLLARCAGLGAR